MTCTTAEAAALAGVTPETVRQWSARGLLSPVNPGRKPCRYRTDDVCQVRYDTRADKPRLAEAARLFAAITAAMSQ